MLAFIQRFYSEPSVSSALNSVAAYCQTPTFKSIKMSCQIAFLGFAFTQNLLIRMFMDDRIKGSCTLKNSILFTAHVYVAFIASIPYLIVMKLDEVLRN